MADKKRFFSVLSRKFCEINTPRGLWWKIRHRIWNSIWQDRRYKNIFFMVFAEKKKKNSIVHVQDLLRSVITNQILQLKFNMVDEIFFSHEFQRKQLQNGCNLVYIHFQLYYYEFDIKIEIQRCCCNITDKAAWFYSPQSIISRVFWIFHRNHIRKKWSNISHECSKLMTKKMSKIWPWSRMSNWASCSNWALCSIIQLEHYAQVEHYAWLENMLRLNIIPELNIMLKLNIMPDLSICPNK